MLGTTGTWAAFKLAFFLAPDPFRGAAYTIGLVFGFATVWAWLYFCSAYTDRVYHGNRVVRWLSVGIYAPLGVAVFSIGVLFVFQQQFITAQTPARGDDLSVYVDDGGRIRDYSRAVPKVFPELDDAVGEALSAAYPALAEAIEDDEQILAREHEGETRYYFVSTSRVTPGDSNARAILLSDVTEPERQRRALIRRERELDEQNELYRAIIDASFDFMSRVDPEGRFTHVSDPVEDLPGYTAEELDGRPITLVVADDDAIERARTQLDRILAGETIQVRDFPLETKAGTTVHADIRGTPVYDGSVPTDDRIPDDIVPVVERVVTQLETQYPGASVSVGAPETATAETLPRIEIALWELVDNAAKHGGERPSIEVGVTVDSNVVRLRIVNDGPGIPEIERSVLMSGEETQLVHGRGLGLWLVYWITTSLDGDIDATATDTGTTVEIRLPRPPSSPAEQGRPEHQKQQ